MNWIKELYHQIRCAFGYHEWFVREQDLVGQMDCFSGCRHCNSGAWLLIDGKRTKA